MSQTYTEARKYFPANAEESYKIFKWTHTGLELFQKTGGKLTAPTVLPDSSPVISQNITSTTEMTTRRLTLFIVNIILFILRVQQIESIWLRILPRR